MNRGILHVVLIALRILLGVLVGIVLGAALAPLLVVADLAGGGTGWGLCPDGVSTCTVSYFAGPELLVILTVVLLAAAAGIAACIRLIRRLEAGQ